MLVSQSDLIAIMIINIESGHAVVLRTANFFTLHPASPGRVMVNGQCIFVRIISFSTVLLFMALRVSGKPSTVSAIPSLFYPILQ